MKPLDIALTGGIGSGKSAAARYFGDLGAAIIDSDLLSHELTRAGGAAMPALNAEFGPDITAPDGALDRNAMRRIAFGDPGARGRLEAILHPMIRDLSELRRGAALAAGAPYVMHVIPLLVETVGHHSRAQRVLVIDCPEALQISRVMERSQLSRAEVERIMAAQASRKRRLDAADDVIVNDGSMDSLRDKVSLLHEKYLALARI